MIPWPKCKPHGIEIPCARCNAQGAWEQNGTRYMADLGLDVGKAPASLVHLSVKKFGDGVCKPVEVPDVQPPAQCAKHPESLAAACAPCALETIRTAKDPLAAAADLLAAAVAAGLGLKAP